MADKEHCLYENRWGEFGAKLDNIHEDIKELKASVNKQNGRVRVLEGWKAKTIGAIGFAIFAIPILVRLSEKIWK